MLWEPRIDPIRHVQKQLEELMATKEKAQANQDVSAIPEIQQSIKEVQETMQEIEAVVEEFRKEHQKKDKATAEMSDESIATLGSETGSTTEDGGESVTERINQTVQSVETNTRKALDLLGNDEQEPTEMSEDPKIQAIIDRELATSIEMMEEVESITKAEKLRLLERIAELRDERTQRLDNLRAVVMELQAKTDTNDADTQAEIIDYQLFINRVAGIRVDLTDTTSTWVAVKGWIFSDQGGKRWTFNTLKFLGILLATWFLSRILSKMVFRIGTKFGFPALLKDVLASSARWMVIGIGVIWALSALEFSIAPLLAVVGAAGFVIAFAMQDSLSNFAAGLMILMFRPFDLRDLVEAGGVTGKVSSMNLVSTTIKTLDNKLMIVPNSKIWNEVITNATGVDRRRVDMVFGIGYDDDIDKAQTILEELVNNHPSILKKPEPTIRVSELADSSVNFICRPWVLPDDYWEVYWDLTENVKKRFDAEGIGIPFPQRDVHLHIADGRGWPAPGSADKTLETDKNNKE